MGNPCTYWNEGTKTGTWDWSEYDDLMEKLIAINIDPMLCLGYYSSSLDRMSSLPSGMTANYGGTHLPNPDQYKEYAKDWVEHWIAEGLDITYYEIMNEAWNYYGWGGSDTTRLGYFKTFFNAIATSMRTADATIKLGCDASMMSSNDHTAWWATNIVDLDFLSWHSYLTGSTSSTDSYLISKAQYDEGGLYGGNDYIDPARETYHSIKGIWLDTICSEENLSWAWDPGEVRCIQILNAICEALRYRTYILNGHVLSALYWEYSGRGSYYLRMINYDTNQRHYPYWLHNLMFSDEVGSLSSGDSIVSSSSSLSTIVPLAWKHSDITTIMLVNKGTSSKTISLSGVTGTYDTWKLEDGTESLQTGTQNVASEFTLGDYTILLLRQQTADDPPTYSDIGYNTTIANNPINFSCKWTDDNALSGFIFSTNNTGTWTNETWASLSGTTDWANDTTTLNSTTGLTVQYQWFCNDSANQWSETLIQSIITSSANVPQYSDVGTSTSISATNCTFTVKWQDVEGLSGYIWGTNNTGTWHNETWSDPWSGTPTSGTSTIGTVAYPYTCLNSTVGVTIRWTVWCNDTNDNWSNTGEQFLTTEEEYIEKSAFFSTGTVQSTNELFEDVGYPYLTDSNGSITALDYHKGYQLNFTVSGASETTSVTDVNASLRGRPSRVSGADAWSYNSTTGIANVTINHASEEEVGMEWQDNPGANAIPAPYATEPITVKENVVLRTSTCDFITGAELEFYRVEVNQSYLWLDQTYTSKYYTRYCIYVVSPSNVNLTLNSWFPTKDSSATLAISSPVATNIYVRLYSPNLLTASATDVFAQQWFSANKTLTMTVNTATSTTFTITTTVSETAYNNPPENVEVVITDMDGGNWVFSESHYYNFRAKFWDRDGTADLDEMKIRFTDGNSTVIAVYDSTSWSLDSGDNIVNLKDGTATALDSNLLQVTFPIYFEQTILDALDVDIFVWCDDTSGASDGWDRLQTDYFNIYNVGGQVEYEFSGNAGKIEGGDWNNLYAEADSWAKASIKFRKLQYVDAIFGINCLGNTSETEDDDAGYPSSGGMLRKGYFYFGFDYKVDDTWLEGWYVKLELVDIDRGGGMPVATIANWAMFNATWYYRGVEQTHDYVPCWYEGIQPDDYRDTQRLRLRFWFNKANASTTIGGWVCPVFYGYTPAGNWVLDGSAQPKLDAINAMNETTAKESFFFTDLLNSSNGVMSVKHVDMMRFWVQVERNNEDNYIYIIKTTEELNFKLAAGEMIGVDTPAPIEPVLPDEAFTGGLLGWLGGVFGGIWQWITEALGPAALGFWDTFVGWLDTIASWLGMPNGFSNLLNWLTNAWTWMTLSWTYIISMLTSVFSFLGVTMGKFTNTMSTVVGNWVLVVQGVFDMLDGVYTGGVSLWDQLGMSSWVTLAAILYPLWLVILWEEQGFDAVEKQLRLIWDVVNMLVHVFLTIIQMTLNIIGRIIESIPVVE